MAEEQAVAHRTPVIAAQDLAGRLSFCVALCSAARLPLASGELAPAREVRDVLSAFGLTVIPLSPVLMIRRSGGDVGLAVCRRCVSSWRLLVLGIGGGRQAPRRRLQ